MVLIRKLTTVGSSRGVTLPKTWIENAEKEAGRKIVEISMEINGKIKLSPIFEKLTMEI